MLWLAVPPFAGSPAGQVPGTAAFVPDIGLMAA
ncbi:hypothetical protein BTHI11S_02285 [Bosea thiooxidans]